MVDSAPRDRPAWLRVLQAPPVRIVLLGPPLFLLMGISNGLWGGAFADRPALAVAAAALMAALGLGLYAAFVRWVERRPVQELALPAISRDLALGTLAGAGLYAACVLVLMTLGVYAVEGLNPLAVMLPSLAMALSAGVFEELLHRGVVFRNVEAWLGSWIALLVSAALFGLRHLGNPEGSLVGALAITLEAGVLLAALYMLTRRLWPCIGFHVGWNLTQAGVFSGTVSGAFEQPGLFRAVVRGPDLLTGGAFGMEASPVALLACTGAGLALLALAVRRGHVVPPPWRRAPG
jgi:membrane protease YdiL (CAAX protease family)